MELWSDTHVQTLLPSLLVMLGLCVIFRCTLKNKSLKIRMIPFQIVACILMLLEIGKQMLSLQRGYDLYHLPFHFCSLFLFMIPAMAFYRGKHQKTVTAITSAICGALFLLMLIYPCLIYSSGNIQEFFTDFFSFHTVAFHNLVMLAFLLILTLDLHTPQPKGEPKAAAFFTLGFCVVSATMAQLLKTNYANFYSCNIAPLETVRQSVLSVLGPVATQLIYISILTVLNLGFVLLSYWFYRLVRSLIHIPAGKKTPTAL